MTNAEEKKRVIEILVGRLMKQTEDREFLRTCLEKFTGKSTTVALFCSQFLYVTVVFIMCKRDKEAMRVFFNSLPPDFYDHFYKEIYPHFGIESKYRKEVYK